VAGEQVTAVSELKVTEVCRVSCATQRSIYRRSWCPKTISNSELAKRKGTTLLLKGYQFPDKSHFTVFDCFHCHLLLNSFDTCTLIPTGHFASRFFITHLTEGQDWHERCFPSGPRLNRIQRFVTLKERPWLRSNVQEEREKTQRCF